MPAWQSFRELFHPLRILWQSRSGFYCVGLSSFCPITVVTSLDCGREYPLIEKRTGIRMLGDRLMETGESLQAHVLISHPHWDHIQGFPFFKPAFISGNEITIVGSEPEGITLHRVIADQMNKIYFPIQINELKARISFHPVGEGSFQIGGATIQTLFVNHPALAL